MDITPKQIRLFRELIYQTLGISFSQGKDYLLKEKLRKLLQRSSYDNLDNLHYEVRNGDEYALETLIRYITTNHTFFFREKDHFDFLIKDINRKNLISPLIWCAASSTGEEVYSIVISLLEHGLVNYKIIASDIDKDVLMTMKRGLYEKEKVAHLNPMLLLKYFKKVKVEDTVFYKINDRCRKNIIVKKINLVGNLRFERKFDYIFCRNVMIYFDDYRRNVAINNMLKNLKQNGYIFTGHSESLLTMPAGFETVFSAVYRRKQK